MKINKFFLYFIIAKHVIWGAFIITTPFALNTSTLAILNKFFGDYHIGGVLLILSAFCAIYGLLINEWKKSILYFFPILFFTWLFGLTAISAVFSGHYADGVLRPWPFIFVDQLPAILLALFVTIIIFEPIINRQYKPYD